MVGKFRTRQPRQLTGMGVPPGAEGDIQCGQGYVNGQSLHRYLDSHRNAKVPKHWIRVSYVCRGSGTRSCPEVSNRCHTSLLITTSAMTSLLSLRWITWLNAKGRLPSDTAPRNSHECPALFTANRLIELQILASPPKQSVKNAMSTQRK